MKTGILLTAFGSGTAQTENALRLVEEYARQRFPGLAVRFAFTSPIMRERLAGQWKKSDSVAKALRKMLFERFVRVVVQPLQLVPGVEYGEVTDEVNDVRLEQAENSALTKESPVEIRLGAPLLEENADLAEVARALLTSLPADRPPTEPVLFMGHGSRHPSEARYTALAKALAEQDPRVFVATMKGGVRLEHLLPRLHELFVDTRLPRKVRLLPLLAAVGRHALDDMAGNDPLSWRSQLAAEDIEAVPELRGLMESPACIELWLNRLESALQGFTDTHQTVNLP